MQNPTATINEQQANVMGNNPNDALRNASVNQEQKKKEIKKKAIQGATKGKKDTNVDVAKLNNPEDLLEKYKDTQRLFAQEGVMPVKENMSEENQMIIIKRLRDEGYSDTAVSAIMGNIDVETGGSFSHTQQQEGGKGYGILQLDFQRPYYDTYLKDNNKEDSLNSQLDYFINEINTGSVIGAGNAEQLRNIFGDPNASVEDMTTMLVDRFFKPGKPHLDRRIESAKMRLENMKARVQEETPEQVPQMAEGGLTENDDETLGATEKEVADDIPAQISEGELVVPANVVRYHGLSTYESLRQTALLGLKGLEDDGQLKKVDENGIPVEEDKEEDKDDSDVKVQTVKMLTAKDGAFPDVSGDGKITRKDVLLARGVDLKDGGFPDISGDGKVTRKDILMGRGVNLQEGGSPTTEKKITKKVERNPGGALVIGGGRLDTEKNPPPYGTTKNPRGETTVKYDPPTGTGKYNYTEEGINKWLEDNIIMNVQAVGMDNSGRRYNSETGMIEEYSYKNAMPGTEKITGTFKPEDYFALERVQKETSYEGYNQQEKTLADYFSQDLQGAPKGTLTTPEGKDYRLTNPNLKITAEGPRTQNIIGGDYTDGANLPGFGVDKGTGGGDKKDTVDTIIDELTPYVKAGFTIGALDLLFNQGKITTEAFNWARNNIFSGEIFNPQNWKDFKYQSVSGSGGASAGTGGGASAGAGTVGNTGQSVIGSGGKYYIKAADGSAIEVAVDKVDLKTMTLTSPVQDISGALVQNVTVGKHVIPVGSKVTATPISSGGTGGIVKGTKYTTTLKDGTVVPLNAEDAFVISNGAEGVPPTDLRKYNTGEGALTTTADGVWNWKTGLAAVGAGLSLYDIIENGPSVANVAGLGYSVGVLAQGGVFGATAAAATAGATTTTAATALGTAISVLGWVALAAGLIELFSGPPSTYVGEAAIDFDNDEYSADDILVGGFTGSKFSQENRDGAKAIISTAGGYVAAIEESLEINIGGELFVDVGDVFGLRYGYVDGYDELGMYKYHEKDLDYKLLSGQGQVGKGLRGKDAAEQLMNKINDDINVVTMFALADKAVGGEGYATFDRMTEYRTKLSVLSTSYINLPVNNL